MKSSERRLKLMLLLQKPGEKLTVEEIAKKFGVSRRTIFRDFNALQEINVPVTWDKYAGYGMMKGYKIPPLMFSEKELATIIVGLNFVKTQIDSGLSEDAEGVELKIKNVLPVELKDFMNSLSSKTIVDPFQKYGGIKRDGGDWYTLSSAISQELRVEFIYESSKGEKKTRKVDPYILVYFEDHWNMIGRSHLRGDTRNFRLDRMSEVKIVNEKYELKSKIDIEGLIFRSNEFEQKIILILDDAAVNRFKANLPAKIFKESRENSKKIRIEFFFDNLDFINQWLLQFGADLKIEGPIELKEKRAALLKKMLEG
ncbi:MAG: YafY family transcriptional regulator [Balneolaceae bacterium]|nr:YafY family transcriptional regulator [Balneolaceae bacterium]